MNQHLNNQTNSALAVWTRRAIGTFFMGAFCGGFVIPALHWQLFGDADPFRPGWPVCLHISAFLLSLTVAQSMRCASTVSTGLYAGLVGFVLVTGGSEYPMASAIGLLIHGFIPAAAGSAMVPLLSIATRTLRIRRQRT